VLLSAVGEVGMDVQEARALLESDEYRNVCLQSASDLQTMGISSIPVFFFSSGSFEATVHGSSTVQEFLEVFRRAEHYWKKEDSNVAMPS
jgi:predicted DsbA family dithiol-disulfide isomerase